MEKNGSSLTFTPDAAGTYVIKAGIEINGTFSTAQLTVTVAQDDPTTISIAYNTNQITTGASVNLTANVQNGSGDTTWSCDGTGWSATGGAATFTAASAGQYTIRAKNNGVEATVTITVNNPAPVTTPEPAPTPAAPSQSETTTD